MTTTKLGIIACAIIEAGLLLMWSHDLIGDHAAVVWSCVMIALPTILVMMDGIDDDK